MNGRKAFLVVDDHAPFRNALARTLRPFGTVGHAESVAAGKDMLDRAAWTALFIGVSLPDGSGLDLLAYARACGCAVPALVLTGRHDPVTINHAFDLAAGVLVKPGEWNQIDAFVRRALAAEGRLQDTAHTWSLTYRLSATETAILVATAQGTPHDELVDERNIAMATFKRHVSNMLAKTGDASLASAASRLLGEAGDEHARS